MPGHRGNSDAIVIPFSTSGRFKTRIITQRHPRIRVNHRRYRFVSSAAHPDLCNNSEPPKPNLTRHHMTKIRPPGPSSLIWSSASRHPLINVCGIVPSSKVHLSAKVRSSWKFADGRRGGDGSGRRAFPTGPEWESARSWKLEVEVC